MLWAGQLLKDPLPCKVNFQGPGLQPNPQPSECTMPMYCPRLMRVPPHDFKAMRSLSQSNLHRPTFTHVGMKSRMEK